MFVFNKKISKEIVSACQPWHWKFCWRGKWAIRRSCVHFSSTVMFTITLQWKNLMLIFTGNSAREFSHFFGRCTTPTLHLAKIQHPWLAEAPASSIWNNLLWIFHCSHSLERSFGTPTHTTNKNSHLVHTLPECNFTIWQIYVLPSIWNTAPMNILFHARWSNHPEIIMHTNSQNLALCQLKFFLPKQKSSKEEMKQGGKKYLSAAKITIHILLRSREFFELHM